MRHAFTLVELLVVIIVFAALAAMAAPKFVESGVGPRQAAFLSDLSVLGRGIDRYRTDIDLFPNSMKGLALAIAPSDGLEILGNALRTNPSAWQGPQIDTIPFDPISGQDFLYSAAKSSVPGKTLNGSAYVSW